MQLKSLKNRFTITILAFGLVIGLATYLSFSLVTDRVVTTLGSSFAVKQALLEKSKMLSTIQRDLSLSLKMASSPVLQRWVADENNPALQQAAMKELESYRQSFLGKSLFFVIDQSGHYYYLDNTTDQKQTQPRYTLSSDNINDSWYFRSMREIPEFELNVDYDNRLNLFNVWFNVIIRNLAGNKAGMCGSGIDITSFVDEIVNSSEPGVETILFNREGAITGHRDKQYVIKNSQVRGADKMVTIYDLLNQAANQQSLKQAMASLDASASSVQTMHLTVDGITYLAALSYLPEIKWYNLVLVDQSHFVNSQQFLPVLLVILLAAVTVVLVIGFMLNRLVLTPLQELTTASALIARGDFKVPAETGRNDEIGALARSFAEMARMLKDHTENLEQKVAQRTEDLDQSNRQLAESNSKVMASINYAQMIQSSLLPDEGKIQTYFPNFYALYKPRDIVGGDIYCFRSSGESCTIALIDCTGHGVPGAFMTMTASAVLRHVLDSTDNSDPARVLGDFNRRMKTALQHDKVDTGIDNGLEIALCWYRPAERKIIFAGAKMPIYIVQQNKVSKVAGDKQPIGYRRSNLDYSYTNHHLLVEPGTDLVMTTDGLLDQAGGERGWGFGNRRFNNLLEKIYGQTAVEQRAIIERTLAEYQGRHQQRDDITVIGFSL